MQVVYNDQSYIFYSAQNILFYYTEYVSYGHAIMPEAINTTCD